MILIVFNQKYNRRILQVILLWLVYFCSAKIFSVYESSLFQQIGSFSLLATTQFLLIVTAIFKCEQFGEEFNIHIVVYQASIYWNTESETRFPINSFNS